VAWVAITLNATFKVLAERSKVLIHRVVVRVGQVMVGSDAGPNYLDIVEEFGSVNQTDGVSHELIVRSSPDLARESRMQNILNVCSRREKQ
jgi:hypothetical protein